MSENRNAYLFLMVILVLSGFLRLYGIGWGTDPKTGGFYQFHPDEASIVRDAKWIGVDLYKVKTPYGKAPYYMLAAVARVAGYGAGIDPFDQKSVRFTHLVGRGISVVLGTLTVLVVFGIGRRLGGIWTGVLSAACLGFCAGHIRQSHYYTVDVFLTFWVSLALYLMLQMPSRRTGVYLWCGMACGLAGGTRLVALVLGLPFIVAHLWPEGDSSGSGKVWHRLPWRRLIEPRVVACGLITIVVTLMGEPFLLLDPDHFFARDHVSRFTVGMDVATGRLIRMWTLYDFSKIPYLFYLTHLLPCALGTPLEVAALCGGLLALWRRQQGWYVLLCWLGIYFLLVGKLHTKPIRYVTPMLPMLAVLGAWACLQAGDWLRRRVDRKWVYGLPALLVGVPAAGYGIAQAGIYGVEDARFVAARWVQKHIPQGDGVLAERGGFPTLWMVPEDRYHRKRDNMAFLISSEGHYPYGMHIDFVWDRLKGMRWIVLIEENRMRQYSEVPKQYPIGHLFYSRLASGDLGFKRVATFKISPKIPGWEFSEEGAEPTITAFDHPRVSVYRRTNVDVKDLLARWKAEVEADPNLPDRHIRTGVKAYRQQDWEGATKAFTRAVEVRPGFKLGHLLLGEVYLRQGRRDDAMRERHKASISERASLTGYIGAAEKGLKALAYLRQGRWDDAKGIAKRAWDGVTTTIGSGLKALAYLARGRWDDAKWAWDQADPPAGISPSTYVGMIRAGMKAEGAGYLGQYLEWLASKRPGDRDIGRYTSLLVQVRSQLGAEFKRQKQYEKALQEYLKALKLRPNHAPTYLNLANLYVATERYGEAVAVAERIVQLDSTRANAWHVLARVHQRTGNLDAAHTAILKAIARDPAKFAYRAEHFNIGTEYQKKNQLDKALAIYRAMLAYNPEFREAHVNIGILRNRQGRHLDAVSSFQKAITIAPDSSDAHLGLAEAYEKLKRVEQAVAAYRKALSLTPDHSVARGRLEALLLKKSPQ